MDTTKIVKGDDLMLFDSNKKSIAFATSHTLTLTAEVAEIQCKDSGIWKTAKVTKLGWEITSDNLYCEQDYNVLLNLWKAGTPIQVYFGTKSSTSTDGINSPTVAWIASNSGLMGGKAIITNITVNAASGDNATYSITLQGVGEYETVE